MSEPVVRVGEVIVEFEAEQDLQDVDQEDVDDQLGQDDDYGEDQVVVEISLLDAVALGNFCLIGEEDDVD